MSKDPVVEEVRRTRHEIEAECRRESQDYGEYLARLQARYEKRLVRRAPKSLNVAGEGVKA